MSPEELIRETLSSALQIEAMEGFLKELVRISSSSSDPEGLEQMFSVLDRELTGLAVTTTREEGGILIGRIGDRARKPSVLLVGHVDTVYGLDDPFRGVTEIRDEAGERMLRGPGILDMKGGLVVMIWALKALKEAGVLDRGAYTLVFNSDEELGSPASEARIVEEARRHDLALVFEPGFDRSDDASTVVMERGGMARVQVNVSGVEAHAGNQPELGLSAVSAAAALVGHLDEAVFPSGDARITVCTFRGGNTINQVPGSAEVGIDVRFQDNAAWASAIERIQEAARTTVRRNPRTGAETRAEVEVLSLKPPMNRHPGADAVLEVLLQAASDLGQRLVPGRRNGTSDGNNTARGGAPTLDGLGAVGVGMHVSGTEAVRASSLPERAALLALTLARLQA